MTEFERYSLIINGVKAISGVATPIVIAIIGFYLDRRQKTLEAKFDGQRDIFARRFLKYDEISSLCNDIYCFSALIGHYKNISPCDIIEKKRKLEALVFASLPVWGDNFCTAVDEFLGVCFATNRGPQTMAVSLSDGNRHKAERMEIWEDKMNIVFMPEEERNFYLKNNFGLSPTDSYRNTLLKPAYAKLLCALSESVGGNLTIKSTLRMINKV